MRNPKTTIAGYCVLLATVLTLGSHYLSTGTLALSDLNAVWQAAIGAGLIAASDGGH